jgi:hypothetical protein
VSLSRIVSAARDNFPRSVRDKLGRRVANHCSNPECWIETIGATLNGLGILDIGVAAHITAAASGGPRYNAKLSAKQRSSYENGIWLCQNCAKLVDNDRATYNVDVLRKWKVAAEFRANQQVGKTRSAVEVARAAGERFKAALDLTATPEAAAITQALFTDPNRYARVNRDIVALGISLLAEPSGWELCHRSFKAIIEELIADLAEYAQLRNGVYRFVTTNTSVEKVGQDVWNDETGFRELVVRTERILASSRASFELWRIFLLHDPFGVVQRDEVKTFAATLRENIRIGANVAVASTTAFRSLPLDYSDFHCVPGRLAFVNVVPTYLAARFESTNARDRTIVNCYSHIAETLVERARRINADCFEWRGGTTRELVQRLKSMPRSAG